MKVKYIILSLLCLAVIAVKAQEVTLDTVGRKADYVQSIVGRAEKNISELKLKDEALRQNVRNIVANRYFYLSDLQDKFGKDKTGLQSELYLHHFEFAANLANYLSEEQIEKVKDAMTYGVVPKTYQAHLEMIPTLTKDEKRQILLWLKEAREFAIDAGSSKDKHGWFGKYKGRINNWLSKRGYDLVKEREAWYKRIEAKKKKTNKN